MIFSYHYKLIEHMISETPKTIIGLIITSIIYIVIFEEYVSNVFLLFWILGQILFIYLRFWNARMLHVHIKNNDTKKIRMQIKVFFALLVFSALLWNVGTLAALTNAPSPYEFISLALMMGLITAAIMTLSSIFYAYILYFVSILVPQIIWMHQYHGDAHNDLLLLFSIYLPFILMLSRSMNINLINYIKNNEKLLENTERLQILSSTDPLTNLFNRRYFFQKLDMVTKSDRDHQKNIILFLIDIDYFKWINDTYGHPVGDYILIEFSKKIKTFLRKEDIFARIGGDEFAILINNMHYTDAKYFANRICRDIAKSEFFYEQNKSSITITISIGIGIIDVSDSKNELLYHYADNQLYKAKKAGRNCVK